MSKKQFHELYLSHESQNRIFNGQIIHYTRRDPASGKPAQHVNWMRMIRPTETPVWSSGWQEIVRQSYSNEELLEIAAEIPPIIQ